MNRVGRFFSILFLGANLFCILILWICCLSTLLPPEKFPLFSLIGLAFPAILLVNICFVFFWLIFKIRFTLFPIIGILLVGSYVLDYCPFNKTKEIPEHTLKVISFNTGYIEKDPELKRFTEYVQSQSPDILCLQEFSQTWRRREEAKQAISALGYTPIIHGHNYLLTRLPIISDTIHINMQSASNNNTIACWLKYEEDSVLIVNNHLESNKLSDEDKAEYREMLKDPHRQNVKDGSKHLLRKLGDAATYRGKQTDILCALADSLKGKSIIMCGDLNDTPISYTYQQLSRRLTSAFRQSGRGLGRSFNQSGFPVRIDHIFISDDWQTYHTYIDTEMDISDHYPLVTHIQKK